MGMKSIKAPLSACAAAACAFCASVAAAADAAPGELAKYVAGKVLPWGGAPVMSAEFAAREIDALDVKCDEAWCAIGTKAEYDAYRRGVKAKMMAAIGTMPERTPLNARTVATLKRDGYSVEKVVFESMPGVFVTANLFVPDGEGRRPAVVMSCGHSGEGKDCNTYLRACVIAAKRGFVAFMFDPYYQGERRSSRRSGWFKTGSCPSHTEMGLRASLIDWSAPLLRIWDGMRAIDYVLSRPEVDPERLGYMGQSGGGTMTALMEAADDRIKAAAPSCFLTSLRALCATMGPQDGEQNIYGQLSFGLNHTGYVLIPDIPVALTCKFSDMFPYTGVMTLLKTVRTLETNVGIGGRTFLNCAPGPHGWTEATEQSSVMFLARHLIPECRDLAIDLESLWQLDVGYDISTVDVGLSAEERGCTEGRDASGLPGWRSILDVIAERAAKIRGARRPTDPAGRAAIARSLAKVKLASEASFHSKEFGPAAAGGCDVARVAVQYEGTGHMLPAVCVAKPGADKAPVVVAAWSGRGTGLAIAKPYVEAGHPVMIADVSGVGEIGKEKFIFYGVKDRPDEGLGAMCYLVGEPLVGRRATDMLVLADVMARRCGGRRPLLVASGPLAIPAAHAWAADASALSGVEVKDAPASWRDCVEGGEARVAFTRYADIVPTAYMHYDWTELLP